MMIPTEAEELKGDILDLQLEVERLKTDLDYLHSLVGQTITFEGALYYLIHAWDYDDIIPRQEGI